MAISLVTSSTGSATDGASTSVVVGTSAHQLAVDDRVIVVLSKYSPSADAPVVGDISRTIGDDTLGSWTLDKVVSLNVTGTEYVHAAVFSALVTAAGTNVAKQYTIGGGVTGCYWWAYTYALRGAQALSIETTAGDAQTTASSAPSSGNATSAGAAWFAGAASAYSTSSTSFTVTGTGWSSDSTNSGTAGCAGAASHNPATGGTTTAAAWSAPTVDGSNVKGWAAACVVYKEGTASTITATPGQASVQLAGQAPPLALAIPPATAAVQLTGLAPTATVGSYQWAYPASDVFSELWTNELGQQSSPPTVNLYESVNETGTANDSDYVRSPASPTGNELRLGLGAINTPDAGTVTLRVRARWVA